MTQSRRARRSAAAVLRQPPVAVAALVVLAAPAAVPALRDAATLDPHPAAALHHPFGYLVGAPLFGLWDVLTLLAAPQHYTVIGTAAVVHLAWRILAARSRSRRRHHPPAHAHAPAAAAPSARPPLWRRAVREALIAAAALAALLAFYAAAALVPRPMAAIRLASPDLVAVNFHSHTRHSHDGWSLFTAARNRAWHEAGGFDAAYVTDHYTWAGVDEAAPANPARAGDRAVLLSGMEARLRGRHVNVLGDRSRYGAALREDGQRLDPERIAAARAAGAPPATIVYTMPGPVGEIVPLGPGEAAGAVAVELSDGSPRGLEQVRTERAGIVAAADSLDLAVVAGANLHGWGRAVPAWSVMRLPGWREMAPRELGGAIEAALHRDRRRAATVVERRIPHHEGSAVKLAATVPRLLWSHFRTLSLLERASWLAWCAIWAAARAVRR